MSNIIIFSDIDGTLIDFETYSHVEVKSSVSRLISCQIPIVLCSSKTRAEQANLRHTLGIQDPYIVENGSAIVVPEDYFDNTIPLVVELGVKADDIQRVLNDIRQQTELEFKGYSDMTIAEISEVTGLDKTSAAEAKYREYSETIVTSLTPYLAQQLHKALVKNGLTLISGGKFHTVTSAQTDKGTAVTRLTNLYQEEWSDIVTIGLGDSINDASMLAAVDQPFLVQKPNGHWQNMEQQSVTKVPAVGPRGWRLVVESLFEKQDSP